MTKLFTKFILILLELFLNDAINIKGEPLQFLHSVNFTQPSKRGVMPA